MRHLAEPGVPCRKMHRVRALCAAVLVLLLPAVAAFAQSGTAYFATLATISPTTTLSPGHICVAAANGKDIYCDATLPSATGADIPLRRCARLRDPQARVRSPRIVDGRIVLGRKGLGYSMRQASRPSLAAAQDFRRTERCTWCVNLLLTMIFLPGGANHDFLTV